MRSLLLFTFLFFSVTCFGQSSLQQDSIQQEINGALLFLQQTQKQETDGYNYWKGEWPAYLTNLQMSVYFGAKGKIGYDSNCFSTVTVHNILANVYLKHPDYVTIPPMLQFAEDCISTYQNNGAFSFWHLIPASPYAIRSKNKHKLDGILMRYPNHFEYKYPFCVRYANAPNDADDTSLGWLAYYLGNQVAKINSTFVPKQLPLRPDSLFSQWRDTRKVRRNISYYNYTNGYHYRTKAFLTWFEKESIYTPLTLFFPHHYTSNLPNMNNDVDCAVNANVLQMLAHYNLLNAKGVNEAYKFIYRAMKSPKRSFTSGVYYPTEFTVHYDVSEAIIGGVDSLRKCIPFMTPIILSRQKPDGSWKSKIENNDLQSSVYAVLTLLNVGDYKDSATIQAITKGINYIRSKAVTLNGQVYWVGGIYFSGGAETRTTEAWKSDAVTTALCIEALVKYGEFVKWTRTTSF